MSLSRNSLMMMTLFALSYLGFSGYSYLMRPQRAADVSNPVATATALSATQRSNAESVASVASSTADSSQTIAPDMVDKWLADATGADAKVRAATIIALATAPRDQAIPVLRKVLTSGELQVDRPLALTSLRTLALQQGDTDGRIRGVLREAIYHGDDDATTRAAQAVLDDVENKLEQPGSSTGR